MITLAAGIILLGAGDAPSLAAAPEPVADFTWIQSISRAFTVNNAFVVESFPFTQSISRSLTVSNAFIEDTFPYTEANSASMTVENRTTVKVPIQEAISRGLTVENGATQKITFTEAISRSYTVNNATTQKAVPTEAISRASTVLNHPELRLEVQSQAGASVVYARCGETVDYQVLGTLSDKNNRGLALSVFDLRYEGGVLSPVRVPNGTPSCNNPMVNFVAPAGFTESAGFGGQPVPAEGPQCGFPSGRPAGLKRVGGIQNSFCKAARQDSLGHFQACFAGPGANPTPPPPLTTASCLTDADEDHDGDVDLFDFARAQIDFQVSFAGDFLPGVALPSGCGPAVIAEGSLVAPTAPGRYHVWVEGARANAVASDATGNPFWRIRPTVVDVFNGLIVEVGEDRCTHPEEFDFFLVTECLSGPGVEPTPDPTFVDAPTCLGAFDEDNDGDVDMQDVAQLMIDYRPAPCMSQQIMSAASPHNCVIDASQPFGPTGQNPKGFTSITLNMRCPTTGLAPSEFAISTVPQNSAPTILTATPSGRDVTLALSGPIPPGSWACFTHTASNTKACIGFLPGDVDRNGIVAVADEALLRSCLTGASCPTDLCDINRDGVCNDADVTRLEDLFYGNFHYHPWLGSSLPVCPLGP